MAGILQHLRSSTLDKRPNPSSMVDGQVAINYASGSPGLFFKDNTGALVKVGPVHVGATAPNVSPASGGTAGNSRGEQWLDTSGGGYVMKIWDGSAWRTEAGEFVNATGDIMTGALGLPPASVGSPAIYFSGDTDTGLYSPGANQLAITTSGTERARIDSSGRLLVGTTTAITATNTPQLQVATIETATGNRGITVVNGGASVAAPLLAFAKHRATSSPHGTTVVASGDYTGAVFFNGADGSNFIQSALIAGQVDGTPGLNDMPGRLVFSTTADGASTPTERMRIDSSGRLLVGTSTTRGVGAATTALQLLETTNANLGIGIIRNSVDGAGAILALGKSRGSAVGSNTIVAAGDTVGEIRFAGADGTDIETNAATISAEIDGTPGANDMPGRLVFSTTTDGDNSPTERMRITSSGYVGIGTTGPGFPLHVAGTDATTYVGSSASGTTPTGGIFAQVANTSSTDNSFAGIYITARNSVASTGLSYIGTVSESGSTGPGNFVIGQRSGSNSYAERLRIDSSGRLLVGTTTSTNNAILQTNIHSVVTGDASLGGAVFTAYCGTTSATARSSLLAFQRSRGTTDGSMTALAANDRTGNIVFRGSDGTSFIDSASIQAFVDGTPGANDMPGRLVFSTTLDGTASPAERLRITNDGNIIQNYNIFDPGNAANFITGSSYRIGSFNAPGISIAGRNGTNSNSGFITFDGQSTSGNAKTLAAIGSVQVNTSTNRANGDLVFYTNGDASSTVPSERLRIDSSGRLLVGTSTALNSSANNIVQIAASSTSGVSTIQEIYSYNTGGGVAFLNLNRSNSSTLGTNALVTSGQSVGGVSFAGADGSNFISLARILGEVDGTAAVNDMPGRLIFLTTADGAATPTEAMRINNQRELLIGTTTRTANGGVLQISNGITFPGTQSACSDPNTLDDYEEGTFTPTIEGTTTAGTGTYTTQNGFYTKIGNVVSFTLHLNWSAHTGTGNLQVAGLPFTSSNSSNIRFSVSIYPANLALTAGNIAIALVSQNVTVVGLSQTPTGGGATASIPMDTAAQIIVTGEYRVA